MSYRAEEEGAWVLHDCLSGEVLLACSLLSSTQKDLSALLCEVTEALPVPIRGVISDGQKTIRKAVAKLLPGVPHQLCQFHYLREAAKPIFEADRHAKAQLKQQVRGVRPIERSLEGQEDSESQAMHGYCLAVRSALTDDGRPPLSASGLKKLHDRLTQISDWAFARRGKKGELPPALRELQRLLMRGPVRVVTALALRRQCFLPRALSLKDPEAWYTLREQLTSRRVARRK